MQISQKSIQVWHETARQFGEGEHVAADFRDSNFEACAEDFCVTGMLLKVGAKS
jgi:hypothetical protein